MSIDWHFPPSNGGSYDGFNDAGIETFTGARFDGLAREIIQNSLDAAIDNQTRITVEFDFIRIAREDFPGQANLLSTMKKCEKESNDEKGKAFFKSAVQELQKPKIPCLRITDSGTTGLRGDYRHRRGEWYAITKARGVSDKSDPTAGGSYGIGKNAPFAVSSLRTVFYSTLYNDNGKTVRRAQGKSILMSHPTKDNKDYTQATGFYGEDSCMPIEDDVPEILLPKEQGCVVFIPGFTTKPQWQYEIMATVISNFFCAIEWGNLQILIQDEKENIEMIEKDNLEICFEKIEQKAKELAINPEKVMNSRQYYQTMKSPDSVKQSELSSLGHCKMWVKLGEGLPKQVALLRKTGMLITDDQKGLKRWTGRMDFAGVFLCDSDQGNKLLRDMENPQHNAFEPERAIPDQRKKCEKALRDLAKWIRDSIDELAKERETDVSQLDELNEFFPDTNPPETIPGDEGERDIEGRPVYSPKPLKRPSIKTETWEDQVGEDGGANEISDGDANNSSASIYGSGEGDGAEGSGTKKLAQAVEIQNVRVVPHATNSTEKKVNFTPMKSGDINIVLDIMGDDGGKERIGVYPFTGAKRGKRASLTVVLDNPVNDSVMVRAFQKSEEGIEDENTAK